MRQKHVGMQRRFSQIAALSLLLLAIALPVTAQPVGAPTPQPPPSMRGPAGGQPPLPGQAAPIPLPNPGVMAQAPGNAPGTASSPALGGPAMQPKAAAAQTAPAAAGLPKKDNITLKDVEDKLVATRDEFWRQIDKTRNADLLKKISEQQAKLLPVTAR